jgi:hypothetical protein
MCEQVATAWNLPFIFLFIFLHMQMNDLYVLHLTYQGTRVCDLDSILFDILSVIRPTCLDNFLVHSLQDHCGIRWLTGSVARSWPGVSSIHSDFVCSYTWLHLFCAYKQIYKGKRFTVLEIHIDVFCNGDILLWIYMWYNSRCGYVEAEACDTLRTRASVFRE